MSQSQDIWLVFLGNGKVSHAALRRGGRTLCSRPTGNAREWVSPGGGEPHCEVCYRITIRKGLITLDFSELKPC